MGGITGGLSGVTFYGAGKAVEVLKDSVRGRGDSWDDSNSKLGYNLQFFGDRKPSNPMQMQQEVLRGQAPKSVKRVDRAHNPNVPNQKPHVHFTDGTSLNYDGTLHDVHCGTPEISNSVLRWLEKHGWKGN